MIERLTASCHCGAVRLRCDVDLAEGTSRCNCSICAKSRFWKLIVPAASFELLQGGDALTDYRFGSRTIRHCFCRECGVKVFGQGEMAALGGVFYAVNVACLDGVPPERLLAAPLRFEDGLHDNWGEAPAQTQQL